MNIFYSYIYSLAVAAAAAGIVTALAPDGGQLKKYVKYIAALCMLLMLILPARGAVSALADSFGNAFDSADVSDSGSEETSDAESEVLTQTAANIGKSLRELLAQKLGCDSAELAVVVKLNTADQSAIAVDSVKVRIPKEYTSVGLELWVAEKTGCAVKNVVIEWI
jgi:Stage III sporulation protein AF (Spore_III_AF).